MATIQLPPDFKDLLRLLHSEQVEYLLVGGYAVGYYGYPRATGDMDIWIACDRPNAAKVVAALRRFGFSPAGVSEEMFLEERKIVRIGMPPLRIELLTSASGVEFAACYTRRTVDVVDGIEISLISREDLKINKKAAGRTKDLADLEHLS